MRSFLRLENEQKPYAKIRILLNPRSLDILDVKESEGIATYMNYLRREGNKTVTDAKKEQIIRLDNLLQAHRYGHLY